MRYVMMVGAVVAVSALALSAILISGPSGVLAGANGMDWQKEAGQLTLGSEEFVGDAWVIKDGTTYKMWYTHVRADATLEELASQATPLNPRSFVNRFLSEDFAGMWDQAAGIDVADITTLTNSATPVIGYATSDDGIAWTIVNSEVLSAGTGIDSGVGAPSVIKDGETYRMWYSRVETSLTTVQLAGLIADLNNPGATREAAVATLMGSVSTVIGYATSPDGIDWTVQNDSVLAGSAGVLDSVGTPSVIKDGTGDTTYKMWYSAIDSNRKASQWAAELDNIAGYTVPKALDLLGGITVNIGYATSPDGIDWTVADADVVPGSTSLWNSVGDASVVKVDTTYHMWYTRARTNLDEAKVLSIYGNLTFQFGEVDALFDLLDPLDIHGFIGAFVTLSPWDSIKGDLVLSGSVIAYATSSDGSTWTVQEQNDLVGATDNPWSSVAAPTVVSTASAYEMWYTEGVDEATEPKLYALLDGSDLALGYASATTGASIEGHTYEVNGTILANVTVTMDGQDSVVSDGNGFYQITASTTGDHTLVASREGFKNQQQTIGIDALDQTYTLDFKAINGLVPNAPNLSYVLGCINKWKFPPEGFGLSLSKVLSVINAWKFPIP